MNNNACTNQNQCCTDDRCYCNDGKSEWTEKVESEYARLAIARLPCLMKK